GIPGDAPKVQETRVEPRPQEILQIPVKRPQLRILVQQGSQIEAHIHQELDAFRQGVELAQETNPWRFQGLAQAQGGRDAPLFLLLTMVVLYRCLDGLVLDREVARENLEKNGAALRIQLKVGASERGRPQPCRNLSPPCLEALTHLFP